MKPLAGYVGYNSEWRELAQVISRVRIENSIQFRILAGINDRKNSITIL